MVPHGGLTGNLAIYFQNNSSAMLELEIRDHAYKMPAQSISLPAGPEKTKKSITINTAKSFGWYDITIKIKGNTVFERRYAGRVESGEPGKTDPFMGRMV
jgi:phospholipase C